jgi:hypothetical protein
MPVQNRFSTLRAGLLSLSLLCLSLGTSLAGDWVGAAAAVLILGLALVFRRRSIPWMPSLLLGLYTLAAALGLLRESSPLLLLNGLVFALGAWDLDHAALALSGSASSGFGQEVQRRRLLLSAGILGLSLLLVTAGQMLHIRLPFGVVLLLALAALGSLALLNRLLQQNH